MENIVNQTETKENNNKNQIEQPKEEISKPESKKELDKDEIKSEEVELKDDYSIDDISYSKLEKSFDEIDEYSLPLKKKKKIIELTQYILEDNIEEFKKIIDNNKSYLKKKTLDGFSFIQYAVLNGAFNCTKYLIDLKVPTNEDIEGFYLIHLSIMKSIKPAMRIKCIQMLTYIYETLPEQRKLKDRLGRTYLHLVIENNLFEIFNGLEIPEDDLFVEDNQGHYPIEYVYMYDSFESFCSYVKTTENLNKIYMDIRKHFSNHKISSLNGEEIFLENLIIHQNHRIISLIMGYGVFFQNVLIHDFNIINQKYGMLLSEKKDSKDNAQLSSINSLIIYIQSLGQDPNMHINNNIYNKTAIVYNKDCINHIKLPDDDIIKHMKKKSKIFENSDRLFCLIDEKEGIIINNSNLSPYQMDGMVVNNKYIFIPTQRKSCLNDILKCHDIKYIKALKYKNDNIKNNIKTNKKESNSKPPKFWDNMNLELIEKNYFLYNDNNQTDNTDNNNNEEDEEIIKEKNNNIDLFNYQKIDIDTLINEFSYENIFNTTGCIFEAIDTVMSNKALNAFALIRPPGHHAGYYGPVENAFEPSNGFCLVNNVAIGAAYAKYKYQQILNKIAIVDIDVHHGNGTEEIVEMLNFKNFSKPFVYEKICGVKLEDKRSINWLDFDDAKNVLFISTHIYDKNSPDKFYPYSGSEEKNTPKDSEIYPGGIYNIPFEYKKNYPYDYRNILRTKIIPRLFKFKPDIIFISAGFDGHKLEKINEKNFLLQENDYGYIAEQIQFAANTLCKGRLIAVLEGGYNVDKGFISPFAQSVLKFTRHMNIAINMLQCNDVKISNQKREYLYNEEMEIYTNNIKEEDEEKEEEKKPRRSQRLRHLKETVKKEKEFKEAVNENKKEELMGCDILVDKKIKDENEKIMEDKKESKEEKVDEKIKDEKLKDNNEDNNNNKDKKVEEKDEKNDENKDNNSKDKDNKEEITEVKKENNGENQSKDIIIESKQEDKKDEEKVINNGENK